MTHQYFGKESSTEKKGQCHVASRDTMLQGRSCLCNRGDSASAMRRRCGCDSANPSFKETHSNNDDWTSAKLLGKTEVGRIDTYAGRTMELQAGQRRKIQKLHGLICGLRPTITLKTELEPPERTVSQNVQKGETSRIKNARKWAFNHMQTLTKSNRLRRL